MLKDGLVGVLLGILISSFFISCGVPVIEEIPSHATTGRLFDLTKSICPRFPEIRRLLYEKIAI